MNRPIREPNRGLQGRAKTLPSLTGHPKRRRGKIRFATAHDVIHEEGSAANAHKLRLNKDVYDDIDLMTDEDTLAGW